MPSEFLFRTPTAWRRQVRIASSEIKSSAKNLVAVRLPIAIAREDLERGYLHTGGCPGDAEPVDKMVSALPGEVPTSNRAGWR
jgi:type IV secretory pathway protease TraF